MKGKLVREYAKTETRENVLQFALRILGLDGGPGSGNFGHSGRPGEVGGSASEYIGKLKDAREAVKKMSPKDAAERMYKSGLLSYDDSVSAWRNGTIHEVADKIFDIMEENGDPTPVKLPRTSPNINKEVYEGKWGQRDEGLLDRYTKARLSYIKEFTGCNDEQAWKYFNELGTWFGGGWGNADTKTLDDYIDSDGVYDGEIYRGIDLGKEEYEKLMRDAKPGGVVRMIGMNSSWTTSKEMARTFAGYSSSENARPVIFKCIKNKTAAPVAFASTHGEDEVLAHSRAQWTVLKAEEGSSVTVITVIEKEERMSEEDRDKLKEMYDSAPDNEPKSLSERMKEQQKYFRIDPPKKIANDGGPGSGNFGHSGRPGKVGGSAKGSGGTALRIGSKESGYSSFAKSEAFNGIVSHAKASGNYKDFVRSMSKAQKDALRDQRIACGTEETMQSYATRIYNMLHNRNAKPEIRQKNKPVNGKDISKTFSWDGKPYTGRFGQIIDTKIEAAIDAQGFNGVPKIVSGAEFNRIVQEHPETPLLYRSYAAENPEALKKYDEMLEKGEWYVDCGTGGAQYGQGMYCAGVYQQEPLYSWDDPKMELDDNSYFVFTINQEGFKGRKINPEEEDKTEALDLWVDMPYLVEDKDGNRRLIKQDLDSGIWEDIGKGGIVDEEEVTEYLRSGKVYECRETDIGIYKDAYDKGRKEGIRGAKEEMNHYRNVGLSRLRESPKPIVPDGMDIAQDLDSGDHYYFDPKQSRAFSDDFPTVERNLVCIQTPGNPDDKSIWRVLENGEGFASLDGRYKLRPNDVEPYQTWSYVYGKCDYEEMNPVATTRLMTLDPSAKIITHREIQNIQHSFRYMDQVARRELQDKIDAYKKENPEPEVEYFCDYYPIMSESAREEKAKSSEALKRANEFMEKVREEYRIAGEEAKKYAKIGQMDEGVLATLLGYYAINAEGHGESGSYTIVLNRTKIILSEDEVDVAS